MFYLYEDWTTESTPFHNIFHGWGANLTLGGEGTTGWKHTEITRQKMKGPRASIVGDANPMSTASLKKRGQEPPGIHFQGDKNPAAKLSWELVEELRVRYAAGGCSYHSLAAELGMSAMPVYDAITGRTWKKK